MQTATTKQMSFLSSLVAERQQPEGTDDAYIAMGNGTLTKRDASALIEKLLASPRTGASSSQPTPELEVGIYRDRTTGEYRKVYTTRRGFLVAKVAELEVIGNGQARVEWVYVGKSGLAGLDADDMIDAVEAAAFGKLTGQCVYCAQKLTDERSLSVGYGPTCAENNGLPWGEVSEAIDLAAERLVSAFTSTDGKPDEQVAPAAPASDDDAYWASLLADADTIA